MITPELIGYIRTEFVKGRTREEVRAELVKAGGWNEADLSEAFRIVIPMQGSTLPNIAVQSVTAAVDVKNKNKTKSSKTILENLIFIVVGIACVLSWYFYRPQIVGFWNSGVEISQELSVSSWNSFKKIPVNSWNLLRESSVDYWDWLVGNFKKISIPSFNLPSFSFNKIMGISSANKASSDPIALQDAVAEKGAIKEVIASVKDCGTANSPNLKNKKTYENNTVLNCLGNSAARCEDAQAILKDSLFPDVFQIVRNLSATQETCSFKLSYGKDSALTDITGKKLAGQSISCPVSVVKSMDETKKPPLFTFPDTDNSEKYASQIYFYGTLGLFLENNIDQGRIRALGCSGDYIDSVIASYQEMQSKR